MEEESVKICRRCKLEKSLSEFRTSKQNSDGLRSECRDCNKYRSYRMAWRKENFDKVRAGYQAHINSVSGVEFVTQSNFESVVNINHKADMMDKHRNSPSWQLYASKICGNPFVADYLRTRENGRCACCGRRLIKKPNIHHIDYDHECVYDKGIRISSPTEKQPKRKLLVPDCRTCFITNRDKFNACMSRVVLVHTYCNYIISRQFRFSRNTDGKWGETLEYSIARSNYKKYKSAYQEIEA